MNPARLALAAEIRSWRTRNRAIRNVRWSNGDEIAAYGDALKYIDSVAGREAHSVWPADTCTIIARALRAFATALPRTSHCLHCDAPTGSATWLPWTPKGL